MVHFIRTANNRTIIECMVYIKHDGLNKYSDLSAVVNISEYSKNLLEMPDTMRAEFVDKISDLSEIRGAWWERWEDSGEYVSIDEFVEECFMNFLKVFTHYRYISS
jgi:hypothetical protein